MHARRIVLAGLPSDDERELIEHASALGFVTEILPAGTTWPGAGGALVAYPASDLRPPAADAAIAIGLDLDPRQQEQALDRGAADVIDLGWSSALIAARLTQLAAHRELHERVATHFAAKERDLADARALQLALVPPSMARERVTIDAVLEPALELGGDLVDYILTHDGRIVLGLGDVSGKGAAAALTMARTHTLLRSLALRSYAAEIFSPPDNAAKRLNGMLAIDNDVCIFVTMFLGLFDPTTGQLDYIRCGHIPPFLRRRDGSVERLDAVGGLPLGVDEDATYEVGRVTLLEGDTLLIVSDGVTEAEAPDGALLDEEPVVDWLREPRQEIRSLVELTRVHEQGGAPSDDLSAMLLQFH